MRAVILAAGPGSRLLPHTQTTPKCLLEVAGYTILEYQLAALRRCGISDLVIVVGHRGEKIKARVHVPVTFVENPEYRSTGPSYSLWLARELIRHGFVYINSDLIFDPRMLEILLHAPAPDAIVIDRRMTPGGDMMKAQMEGDRIVDISKEMPMARAAAEVIGPAKFSAEGAAHIISYLDRQIAQGKRRQWAYEAFGAVARERRFAGVENPHCFWAEIDTAADLVDASQRIPPGFIDFDADGPSAAGPREGRLRKVNGSSLTMPVSRRDPESGPADPEHARVQIASPMPSGS